MLFQISAICEGKKSQHQISLSCDESLGGHIEAEKPEELSSAEQRLELMQEMLELAMAKSRGIDQKLESVRQQSSCYGDKILYKHYELFPQTPQLSFSFTNLNNSPQVSVSSI